MTNTEAITKLEIERRWLVKLPLSKEASIAIEEDGDAPARIVQTYLKSDDGSIARVRFVEVDMWGAKFSHFVHTEKKIVEMGTNIETEQALSEAEYQVALLERDDNHSTIEKTRYHLHHKGMLFELDIFEGSLEGLAILELELHSMDDEFELPPYLSIEREITKEKGWSNFDLSLCSHLGNVDQYKEWRGSISSTDSSGNAFGKSGWFDALLKKVRSIYDGRNERVSGGQIDENDL